MSLCLCNVGSQSGLWGGGGCSQCEEQEGSVRGQVLAQEAASCARVLSHLALEVTVPDGPPLPTRLHLGFQHCLSLFYRQEEPIAVRIIPHPTTTRCKKPRVGGLGSHHLASHEHFRNI